MTDKILIFCLMAVVFFIILARVGFSMYESMAGSHFYNPDEILKNMVLLVSISLLGNVIIFSFMTGYFLLACYLEPFG